MSGNHGRLKVSTVGCGDVAQCGYFEMVSTMIQFNEVGCIVVWKECLHDVAIILGV